MLTLLVVSYWVLMALVNVIPVLGTIASDAVHPGLLGQPDECLPQHRSAGRPLAPQLLFSGFQQSALLADSSVPSIWSATLGDSRAVGARRRRRADAHDAGRPETR
jgi:hypothetical protein